MGSNVKDGTLTLNNFCALIPILFMSWLYLTYYQSRFHRDDLLTNLMCACFALPPSYVAADHKKTFLYDRYGANMFFVLLMSQHVDNNSFNVIRFAVAAGCQRLITFCMYLRCRIAMPDNSFPLSVYCIEYLFASAMYFVFAIGVASNPQATSDQASGLFGSLQYNGIIPAIEFLTEFSNFAPFFANRRLPLDIPYVINRFGQMMLLILGEVSISLTQ
jgi:hypothetical protein